MDADEQLELRATSGNERPVLGISEWMCYYANYDKPCPGPKALDECVELHLRAGCDHLVWNLGRSVVDYWSELPHITRMCENGDQVGGASWGFVHKVMDEVCPLRHALALCHGHGAQLWGRLGMNRHYGRADWIGATSRFALDNPAFREVTKPGNEDASRLCYALAEVRRERIDILLECQRIGVDGLVLDFCRQMPMLLYHPALVEPFMAEMGVDPREIDSDDFEQYRAWFQYRADVLTGFMTELRRAVRAQEGKLGRRCPIVARVPDNVRWLMLAYGLDSERWCLHSTTYSFLRRNDIMSMCRIIWTATACWLLYGSPLLATPVEFGVQFEVASFFKQGSTDERTTFVSIPSARSLYILWFPGENASFGPYFAFHSSWGNLHSVERPFSKKDCVPCADHWVP